MKSNKLLKIIVFVSCSLIIYSYFAKALNSTNPDAKIFKKWINSLKLDSSTPPSLNDVSLQIVMNTDTNSKTWQLSAVNNKDNINKISRLLELADSSELFLKSNKKSGATISIEIRNKNNSFIANLSTEQIEKDPKLLTFFKLAELYAKPG